jgi:hypothetical protein
MSNTSNKSHHRVGTTVGWILGCMFAATMGVLLALTRRSASRSVLSSQTVPDHLHFLQQFVSLINAPPFLAVVAVLALAFLIYKRLRGVQCVIASFLGAGIAAQLIRDWFFR